jgi:septum site-determining protein MinC
MALVLAPEAPLSGWLSELDRVLERSPTFFLERAVVLDVSLLKPARPELADLIAGLQQRAIRIMALDGADPALHGPDLPPPLLGGRDCSDVEGPGSGAASTPAPPAPPPPSMLVDGTVRSGQSVFHADGDVTILGSVSSGAEVIAGGSIHVYGALRGRAIAGASGNAGARIYCRKLEAELLAIDGLYRTADEMPPELRGRAAQIRLEGDAIKIAPLE